MLAIHVSGPQFLSESLINLISRGPKTKDLLTFLNYDHSPGVQSIKLFLPLVNIAPLNPQRYQMRDFVQCFARVKIPWVYRMPLYYPCGHTVQERNKVNVTSLGFSKICHSLVMLATHSSV